MRAYRKLFQRFILRALVREKLRASLTVLGISLGVGVMLAIRLANTSALTSFRVATEAVAGETALEITGIAGRFDELRLRDLAWLREYGQLSPVIEGYAMMESNGPETMPGEFLQVLGVDILRDRGLRRYRLIRLTAEEREPSTREFLLLLADPQAIVITEKLARRHNLAIGSTLPLLIGDTRRTFIVRGLLLDEGPARALDGNFALMDLAAAQWAFGRIGLLDRVDLKLRHGLALAAVETEIAGKLPAGLTVVHPGERYGQIEKMIAAFHFNLNALASIALLVGLFLIYNTVSISVITRRDEIGLLRAVGVNRPMVLFLFLGEAALLAGVGTCIGLGLGRLLANAAVRATATTVETFYLAVTQTGAQHALGVAEVMIAYAVALPLALLAAAVPALEAARVQPVEAMRGAERLRKSVTPSRRYLALALALLVLSAALSRIDAVAGLPLFGYLAALALVFGGAFLVPGALWLVCQASGRILTHRRRIFPLEGKLASANLGGAIPRVSISVAALAVSLAMMVAISIMIGSFRETVAYWVEQTLRADIYTRPVARTAAIAEGEITPAAVEMVKADPQVAAVDTFAARQVSFQGNLVTLAAGDFAVLLEHGRLLFKAPRDGQERLRWAIGRDAVVVSESFALRFGKEPGDTVELPTPAGPRPFTVAAVYYDYSSNRGTAVMDRTTYARYFPAALPSSLSIYVEPDADVEEVRNRLAGALSTRYQLVFTTNRALRGEVMRIFDSTFAITYALEVIAIVVAGLGVISTLITLILERQPELALLNILGATRAQIRRMIVAEAVFIGGVSQFVGLFIGMLLSFILIYVINLQSFGWTIQFHVPVGFLVQSTLLILVATAVAGLYPAARAARLEAIRFVREE